MKSLLKRMTLDQRTQLLGHLRTGADLPAVCKAVGATMAQLKLEMKSDPDFAQTVAAAEARVELIQMGQVSKAAQDEKNWRASVWWIDRRDRIRAAGQGALTEDAVLDLLDELARAIVLEVHDAALQRRIIEQLLDAFERRQPAATELPQPIAQSALISNAPETPSEPDVALPATLPPQSQET
jgi:hypothetical protein